MCDNFVYYIVVISSTYVSRWRLGSPAMLTGFNPASHDESFVFQG